VLLFLHTLRKRGERLSRRAVLDQLASYGRLHVRQAPHEHFGARALLANLVDGNGHDLLQPLVHARVVKINLGIHLTGLEMHARGGAKSRVERWSQSWLCANTAEDLSRLVNFIPAQVGPFGELIDEDDMAF